MKGFKKLILGLFLAAIVSISFQAEAKADTTYTSEGLYLTGIDVSTLPTEVKISINGETEVKFGEIQADGSSVKFVAESAYTAYNIITSEYDATGKKVKLITDNTKTQEQREAIKSGTVLNASGTGKIKLSAPTAVENEFTITGVKPAVSSEKFTKNGVNDSIKANLAITTDPADTYLLPGDKYKFVVTESSTSVLVNHGIFEWWKAPITDSAKKISDTVYEAQFVVADSTETPSCTYTYDEVTGVKLSKELNGACVYQRTKTDERTVSNVNSLALEKTTWLPADVIWSTDTVGATMTSAVTPFRVATTLTRGEISVKATIDKGLDGVNPKVLDYKITVISAPEFSFIDDATGSKGVVYDILDDVDDENFLKEDAIWTCQLKKPGDKSYSTISGHKTTFTPSEKGTYSVKAKALVEAGAIEGLDTDVPTDEVEYKIKITSGGGGGGDLEFDDISVTVGSKKYVYWEDEDDDPIGMVVGDPETEVYVKFKTNGYANANATKKKSVALEDLYFTGLQAGSVADGVTLFTDDDEDGVTGDLYVFPKASITIPTSTSGSTTSTTGGYQVIIPRETHTSKLDLTVSGALLMANVGNKVYNFNGSSWGTGSQGFASGYASLLGQSALFGGLSGIGGTTLSGITITAGTGLSQSMTLSATALKALGKQLKADGIDGDKITFMIYPYGTDEDGNFAVDSEAGGMSSVNVYKISLDTSSGAKYTVDGTDTTDYFYAIDGLTYNVVSSAANGGTFSKWEGASEASSTTSASLSSYKPTSSHSIKAIYTGGTPTPTVTASPTPTGSGSNQKGSGGSDDLDDVPKTGESKADIWILWSILLASILGAGFMVYRRFGLVKAIARVEEEEAVAEEVRKMEAEAKEKEDRLRMLKDLRNLK